MSVSYPWHWEDHVDVETGSDRPCSPPAAPRGPPDSRACLSVRPPPPEPLRSLDSAQPQCWPGTVGGPSQCTEPRQTGTAGEEKPAERDLHQLHHLYPLCSLNGIPRLKGWTGAMFLAAERVSCNPGNARGNVIYKEHLMNKNQPVLQRILCFAWNTETNVFVFWPRFVFVDVGYAFTFSKSFILVNVCLSCSCRLL